MREMEDRVMSSKYDVARHKGKWYVIGHLSGRYWMPVSDPCSTRNEAVKRMRRQHDADRGMIAGITGWDVRDPASAIE